jgi:predicted nucleic acid-binding protein
MTVRAFADSNVAIYCESDDGEKTRVAVRIIRDRPVISTQVVNETIAVLVRKYGFSRPDANSVAAALMEKCEVVPVDEGTVRDAMDLAGSHRLSHWDALIVAAAARAGCDTLYSEDFQDGQVFSGRLTVVNPFAGLGPTPAVHDGIIHVIHARYLRDHVVWLQFNDGTTGSVDLAAELEGPVFGPLKDVEAFKGFTLAYHTLTWPNGADFAPEFLRERASVSV